MITLYELRTYVSEDTKTVGRDFAALKHSDNSASIYFVGIRHRGDRSYVVEDVEHSDNCWAEIQMESVPLKVLAAISKHFKKLLIPNSISKKLHDELAAIKKPKSDDKNLISGFFTLTQCKLMSDGYEFEPITVSVSDYRKVLTRGEPTDSLCLYDISENFYSYCVPEHCPQYTKLVPWKKAGKGSKKDYLHEHFITSKFEVVPNEPISVGNSIFNNILKYNYLFNNDEFKDLRNDLKSLLPTKFHGFDIFVKNIDTNELLGIIITEYRANNEWLGYGSKFSSIEEADEFYAICKKVLNIIDELKLNDFRFRKEFQQNCKNLAHNYNIPTSICSAFYGMEEEIKKFISSIQSAIDKGLEYDVFQFSYSRKSNYAELQRLGIHTGFANTNNISTYVLKCLQAKSILLQC